MVISGSEMESCPDCYANIITSTDTQLIVNIRSGPNGEEISVADEGLAADIIYGGIGTYNDPFVIKNFELKDLPANGLLIRDIDSFLLIKDFTFKNLGKGNRSSMPVGIGTQYAKNVRVENCTALSGESFRLSYSENVSVKNCTGRNILFEGVKNGLIDDCTSNCILIKGLMSPFYSYKLFDPIYDFFNDTLLGQRDDDLAVSQSCIIKNCERLAEIDIFDAEDCIVENCSIEGIGLWMMNAKNVTFRNSTFGNATLSLDWSRKINFENMTFINSTISLAGSIPEDYAIVFKNSTIDGRPIYYYENQSDLEIKDLNAGYISLVNCPGAKIEGINALGIFVANSDGAIVKNSRLGWAGIHIAFSSNCAFSNNTLINQKSKDEIMQYAVCNNNTVSGNVVIKETGNLSLDLSQLIQGYQL
ncbi:MAG: hypothetical protein JW999_11325 [Methanotrichaceae archaeon]|nr:hypothetical protein [Methanotrichaceae archaeon]